MSSGYSNNQELRELYRRKLDEVIALLSFARDRIKTKLKDHAVLESERIRLQSLLVSIESAIPLCRDAYSTVVAAQVRNDDYDYAGESESGRPISPRSELTAEDRARISRLPPIQRDEGVGIDWDEISKLL